MAMVEEGLTLEEARKRIFLVDSRGLIVKDRPKGGINHEKAPFAQEHEPIDDLGDVVKTIKPSVLIGEQGEQMMQSTIFFSEGAC